MTSSEIRYRRLLTLYPRDFRREYEEEILGVLMADPRPGPGQIVDLVRAALTARLRAPFAAGHDWRRAARLVQLFGAVLLLAVAVRRVAMSVVEASWPDAPPFTMDTVTVVRLVGWSVVLIAALSGRRSLGLAGAILGLGGEIAAPAPYYQETPATVLDAFWLIAGAAVVLVAGLLAEPGRRARGLVPIVLAGAVLVLHGVILRFGFGLWPIRSALPWIVLALAAYTVLRQPPAVRQRLLVWAVPVLVTEPLVRVGFGGFIEYNTRHPESLRMLGPLHVLVLVLVPAAAFLVAAEMNRRWEDSRFRPAIGRTSKDA